MVSTHTVRKEHLPGFAVSLWKRTQQGSLLGFTLMVRATSRHALTKHSRPTFDTEFSPLTAYDQTVQDPTSILKGSVRSVGSQLDTAEAIVLGGQKHAGAATLPILFAVVRVRSQSKNRAYFVASEGFCRILSDKHILPSPLREDLFIAWVRECLAKLLTTAIENNGKMTSRHAKAKCSRTAFDAELPALTTYECTLQETAPRVEGSVRRRESQLENADLRAKTTKEHDQLIQESFSRP